MIQDTNTSFDIRRITEILPHRYPFLLVDRVIECVPFQSIKAYKNITINEPFFQGHFPNLPVMPGVLILEALAQTGGLMVAQDLPKNEKHVFLFTGLENVKFRRPVYPGDRIDMECKLLKHKMKLYKMECWAKVDGNLAVEAIMTAVITKQEVIS